MSAKIQDYGIDVTHVWYSQELTKLTVSIDIQTFSALMTNENMKQVTTSEFLKKSIQKTLFY